MSSIMKFDVEENEKYDEIWWLAWQTNEYSWHMLVIMRDENLIDHLLNSNDAADVVQMVAGHVIVEARGFLDLLSGMIALRTSPSPPSWRDYARVDHVLL